MSKSKQHDRKRRAHRWMLANGFTSKQNRLVQSLDHVATLRKQELRAQLERMIDPNLADDSVRYHRVGHELRISQSEFERRCRAEGL